MFVCWDVCVLGHTRPSSSSSSRNHETCCDIGTTFFFLCHRKSPVHRKHPLLQGVIIKACSPCRRRVSISRRLTIVWYCPYRYTEPGKSLGTWLREISSCSCLTFLPGPAWVLLSKICQDFLSALYVCLCVVKLRWPNDPPNSNGRGPR